MSTNRQPLTMHTYSPKTPHLSMDLEIKPTGFLALLELDDELEDRLRRNPRRFLAQ